MKTDFRNNSDGEYAMISVSPREKVQIRLRRNGLTNVWLAGQLEKRGITTDNTELSRFLSGKRVGDKATRVITESMLILTKYERLFAADVS